MIRFQYDKKKQGDSYVFLFFFMIECYVTPPGPLNRREKTKFGNSDIIYYENTDYG